MAALALLVVRQRRTCLQPSVSGESLAALSKFLHQFQMMFLFLFYFTYITLLIYVYISSRSFQDRPFLKAGFGSIALNAQVLLLVASALLRPMEGFSRPVQDLAQQARDLNSLFQISTSS